MVVVVVLVVVGCEAGSAVAEVVAAEDVDEGVLEVAAGTGVDDGVHRAVAVAEPEDDLEEPRRSGTSAAHGLCNTPSIRYGNYPRQGEIK